MKKKLLGALMLTLAIDCAAETKQALTLHMASGANIVYYLDAEPSIGFEQQAMIVTVGDAPTTIPMQAVDHWEIGMTEYSAIGTIPGPTEASIKVYGKTLTIHNPNAGNITVYNTAGEAVGSSTQCDAQFTLPHGIYLITIANNTYKIAIR